MAETAYYKFPLYDPEDAPDLTASGEEAQAIEAIDTALHAEHLERVAADEAEAEARESADTELSKEIAREATERKEADEAEAEARKAADTALGERIDAEADTRATEYELLKGKLETEAETRETADNALSAKVADEQSARETADSDLKTELTIESNARTVGDDRLAIQAAKIADNLTAESTTRQEQDTILGTEVTGLNNSVNGIMGLNYGADNDPLVKVEEGAYSSPALEKIAKQFEESGGSGFHIIVANKELTEDDIKALQNTPELVMVMCQGVACFYLGPNESTMYASRYYDVYGEDKDTISLKFAMVLRPEDISTLEPGIASLYGYINYTPVIRAGNGISVTNGVISVASSSWLMAEQIDSVPSETPVSLGTKLDDKIIAAFAVGTLDATLSKVSLFGVTTSQDDTIVIKLVGHTADGLAVDANLTIDNSGSYTEVSYSDASYYNAYGTATKTTLSIAAYLIHM